MKSGDYVKLIKPKFEKTFGQGEPPEFMTVKRSGKIYKIGFGNVFKLTAKGDPVGDPDGGILHVDFVKAHKEEFKKIKK